MDQHTKDAKNWLDRRYRRDNKGNYLAHQPIYGLQTDHSEPNIVARIARTYHLLQLLKGLKFDSVLDVGGGEGYLSALVRDLFGCKIVHSTDLSVEACHRAGEIFNIQGLSSDATRLPFADSSYDLVLCSEVIEHLSRPVWVIGELARIAKKFVVITTEEFCPLGELERTLRACTVDVSYPHDDLNWFTADDFKTLLGNDVTITAQFRTPGRVLENTDLTRQQVEKILAFLTARTPVTVGHTGAIVISPRNGSTVPLGSFQPTSEDKQQILDRLLGPGDTFRSGDRVPSAVDDYLFKRILCLRCDGKTTQDSNGTRLTCMGCGQTYDVRDGVPVTFLAEPLENSLGREEKVAAKLSGGDPHRQQRIRKLMKRLHNRESTKNSALKQRTAQQILRVLWFYYRDEPISAKVNRFTRRFTKSVPVEDAEMQAVLFPSGQAAAR